MNQRIHHKHPISWRRKARAEAQVRQGRVREGEEADEKMGANIFKFFFDRFFSSAAINSSCSTCSTCSTQRRNRWRTARETSQNLRWPAQNLVHFLRWKLLEFAQRDVPDIFQLPLHTTNFFHRVFNFRFVWRLTFNVKVAFAYRSVYFLENRAVYHTIFRFLYNHSILEHRSYIVH